MIAKNMMFAYAARAYDTANPRTDKYVEVNIPEVLPTIPKDNEESRISLSNSYFVNSNFPSVQATVTSTHYFTLPLANGTECPIYFEKGTKFLLLCPTDKVEEGYLIYL